jgi:N-acetylneuraminate synthase
MNPARVSIGNTWIGEGHPTYVIAEIGINHNGSVELAKQLIDGAVDAGCNAVKFQKRTPELCVPREQWGILRETPWGVLSYMDYRRKTELGFAEYSEIAEYCASRHIPWFASCWDTESVAFIERFNPPCHKVASACITDLPLLRRLAATNKPIIVSTGMSTFDEIERAVHALGQCDLLVAHSTSTYPCPAEELNLRMIHTLRRRFPERPIGYSGHEPDFVSTWAAVAMGATFVERHITLDRGMWGSDQAASLDLAGFKHLVANIRRVETALGDGVKRLQPGEIPVRNRLRLARPEREETRRAQADERV